MEEVNGVSFRDYACASANLVGGMPIEKICEVLGIEIPVWEATVEGWNNKMAELSHEDMAFYGAVFTNPKQGKFADVDGGAAGPEEVLAKFPEWSDTLKMEQYMSEASNVGVEIDFDKEFGISLTEYTQLAAHWSGYLRTNVLDVQSKSREDYSDDESYQTEQNKAAELWDLRESLSNKWEAFYKEKFKEQSINLSDDIEF